MGNSNVRVGSNVKNRIIAFLTAVMLFVSMLSLTTLVAAEEADYAPEEAVVEEYVPAPEPEPEPEQLAPEVEDGDDAVAETPDYETLYEYNEDDEGCDGNEEYEQAVLSIVNFEGENEYDEYEECEVVDLSLYNVPSELTHIGQTAEVYTSAAAASIINVYGIIDVEVVEDTTVTLTSGDVEEKFDFLGWYRGTEAPEIGAYIKDLDNVVELYSHEFTMPEDYVQYFALWGYDGVIGLRTDSRPAIWSISQEIIPSTATHVDVRIRLDQIPIGTHGEGLASAVVSFHYDPTFLSNPRRLANTSIFDFDLLSEAEMEQFNLIVATFMAFPINMTLENARNAVKGLADFAHGWIHTSGSNQGGNSLSIIFYYGGPSGTGGVDHDHGPNIIVMDWGPTGHSEPDTHVYVWFRFDVAPGTPVGSVANIIQAPRPPLMQSGGSGVQLNPGSVTVEGFNILYTANPQGGGTVSNMPTNHTGLVPGTHVTRTGEPTHANVDRIVDGVPVSTTVLFVGWSQTQTNRIFEAGERNQLPADWIPAGGNVTITNSDVTLYAIWGWSTDGEGPPDVLRDRVMLYVENWPDFNNRPTNQTESGNRQINTSVPLLHGTAEGWTFFGWVRGTEVTLPAEGVNWAEWRTANSAVVFDSPHSATMPITGSITYTAIWGNNGVVGANLVIANVPNVDVSGQIASQYVPAGQNIVLNPGTAEGWVFFGWVRGDNVPTSGTDWENWSAVPVNAARIYAANYNFGQFAPDESVRFTAIWGNYDGPGNGDNGNGDNGNGGNPIVGANLVIRNVPNVDATGQIATQYVPADEFRVLAQGTAGTLEFFGWVRGDDVPAVGTVWSVWSADPANAGRIYAANYNFGPFASEQAERFTAVWGDRDIVGDANLIIGNIPDQVPAPIGQTSSQVVPVGQTRTLAHGTAPAGLYEPLFFGTWIRGDVVPPVGAILDEWLAANPTVPNFAAGRTTQVFAEGTVLRYTAIWVCGYGIVGGGANLRINNVPMQAVRPISQTPTQVVPAGQSRVLVHGTAPAGLYEPLFFGIWIRGDVVPPAGVLLSAWLADNPTVANFAAGHTTNIFGVGSSYTYTAIWVCEHGIVGGGGYRNIRIFYYIDNGEGDLERDIENNPHGRLYSARIGETFSLETVLDRNELDSDNEYVFEGWVVFVNGIHNQDYIDDLDVEELHGTFTVPEPDAVTLVAVAEGIAARSVNIVGDEISLVAVWSIAEAEEAATPPRLPQTGIESSILLWVSLLGAALLLGAGTIIGLKNRYKDEIYDSFDD